jgi:hypothetical protein
MYDLYLVSITKNDLEFDRHRIIHLFVDETDPDHPLLMYVQEI